MMPKSTGLYLGRYPSKAKAKQVAKGLREGRIPLPRSVYWPQGCFARVGRQPDGQWGVYIKRKGGKK